MWPIQRAAQKALCMGAAGQTGTEEKKDLASNA